MTSALLDPIRVFLDDLRFATIATTDPDGTPRQAVIWYTLEGDELVINSRVGRRWPSNLLRDPRLSIAVSDGTDGYRWVGLTGTARAVTDQAIAQADIAEMTARYHAHETEVIPGKVARFQTQERITFRVPIQAIHEHLD